MLFIFNIMLIAAAWIFSVSLYFTIVFQSMFYYFFYADSTSSSWRIIRLSYISFECSLFFFFIIPLVLPTPIFGTGLGISLNNHSFDFPFEFFHFVLIIFNYPALFFTLFPFFHHFFAGFHFQIGLSPFYLQLCECWVGCFLEVILFLSVQVLLVLLNNLLLFHFFCWFLCNGDVLFSLILFDNYFTSPIMLLIALEISCTSNLRSFILKPWISLAIQGRVISTEHGERSISLLFIWSQFKSTYKQSCWKDHIHYNVYQTSFLVYWGDLPPLK